MSHPGVAYGYRIEHGRACLVYATDSEHKHVDSGHTDRYVRFFQGADLLIFDAQYTLTEALDRPDWGHSTAVMGAELAYRASVKRLALFHHDPASTDEKIFTAKEEAEAYLSHYQAGSPICEVIVASDGLTIEF
jgi:ribonuclease BN (tRNA processing enzyme)